MAVTRQSDRGKSMGGQGSEGEGAKLIKAEGEQDKEQKIPVLSETHSEKKASSVWSWHEEFTVAWSETFITKKRKRNPRKGE